MCGRFSLSQLAIKIAERYDIEIGLGNYKPRYNCAPSQDLAVISNDYPSRLSYFRWGLIPFRAKDKGDGNSLINARAETIIEKPTFKNAFKRKRCLIPGDGFFEWKKVNSREKIPYRILMKDESIFSMAGIWDTWKDDNGKMINSFAIITTIPNELMKNIHHRMPVILKKKDEMTWLGNNEQEVLVKLLKPISSDLLTAYPVSKLVNSPANDSPEILKPVV